jgi:hypothetical protein
MSPPDPPGSASPIASDITEFAAWEALNPSQARDESERERSLADMERSERTRIWGDRDSSNDARSSDEGADEREREGESMERLMNFRIGGLLVQSKIMRPPEIPSSDAESDEVGACIFEGE